MRPSHILFVRKERLFAEPLSASLGHWVSAWLQEEPLSLCMEREDNQEFLWLFVRPSRILFVQKAGLFAEPSSASLGRWVSARFAGRALEPPHGARGWSGVPLAFYATLAHPFRSEGGVEYARLPSVGASSDISGELLSGKSKWRPVAHSIGVGLWSRDALQKYQRASLVGPRAVRLALGARRLPTVGSHSKNSLLVSDTT